MNGIAQAIYELLALFGALTVAGCIIGWCMMRWTEFKESRAKEARERKEHFENMKEMQKDIHRISMSMDTMETVIRKKGLIG